MAYQSWCIGHLLPLFVQRAVDRPFSLSSKNTTHLAHNFCTYNVRYEKAVPLLNLIQYNMSPCLIPLHPSPARAWLKRVGGFLKLCRSQFSVKPHPITIGLILIGADRFFTLAVYRWPMIVSRGEFRK